jgi:eukaryotic-like serine/threonine-protein kinase
MPLTLFCPVCGAASRQTRCFACQWPLSPENTSRPSQRMGPRQRRSPFRRSQAQRSFASGRQDFSQSGPAGRLSSLQPSPRITRRNMLIGLGVLVAVPGAVAGIWWEMTPHPSYIYRGHSSSISGVAWSPDGKRIASASGDATVQIWNAPGGGDVFTYRGHTGDAPAISWSADSQSIASTSIDGSVHVWNVADGDDVFICQVPEDYAGGSDPPGLSVAWSPDGRYIASAAGSPNASSSYTAQVWDAVNGAHTFTYQGHSQSGVLDVAWSPDSRRIASAGIDGTVQVWDAANGANPFIYKGHTDPRNVNNHGGLLNYPTAPTAVTWSPDGKRIASAGSDGTVQVWDANDGGHVLIYRGHPIVSEDLFGDAGGYPTHVAWSPDGTRIASTGDNMQVWGATDGVNLRTYTDAAGPIAWSPDSKHVVSAASSTSNYTVLVWEAP